MTARLTTAALALVSTFAVSAGATQVTPVSAPQTRVQGVQLAGLFGESDEEKAARQQHEDNQDALIAELRQDVRDLEQSLRQLTGQNEDLGHRLQELSNRLDRQQKDYDYKLCTLSAQLLGAGTTQDAAGGGISCNSTVTSSATAANQPPPSSNGVLGTLPAGPGTVSPDTRPQFDSAMNLLAKAQYDEARAAFRNFADTYPKDDLAPQALYWVGDIAYVQKDYMGAAQTFAENIKKYPTSVRGPDSMLKLGQSLIAMGQNKEGCLTLGDLKRKYPKAPAAVVAQAAGARAASCR
ncbi:MAG: tol-pal system protein YbgF [Alphaproteobacteria bacterium]|nr:tol-pal system protein YbgF [Alphaproteobacteria bacterium]MDE2493722.1 tol-pal system protein YbgF [Alphaproteobacteria bacterium]